LAAGIEPKMLPWRQVFIFSAGGEDSDYQVNYFRSIGVIFWGFREF
jgi:hypothetical protein